MHAKLRAYDYFRDIKSDDGSLSRLACLVQDLRTASDATLLMDNGDFLQGEPIADLDLQTVLADGNPVVTAMNAMGYVAAGLGNHEFDLEAPLLRASLKDAKFPVLCANLSPVKTAPEYQNIWSPRVVLPVTFPGGETLRVGVFSVLPPQVPEWNARRVDGRLKAVGMVDAACVQVRQMRQEGADIVVALAHSGIGAEEYRQQSENAARHVAAVDGVDAVVAGHVHERFPDGRQWLGADVDGEQGRLHGKPAVMPGAMAACLGRLELRLALTRNEDGVRWEIEGHSAEVISAEDYGEDRQIVVCLQRAQDKARQRLLRVVGNVARPVTSHFSMLRSDCAARLVADAKMDAVREFLQETPFAGMPLLASVAPARCGGRDGPMNYVDISAGALRERDVSEIQPFANCIALLRLSGAEVLEWLEMANSLYNRLEPARPEQLLFDRDAPPYKRETIFGMSYQVDLSQPARYALDGRLVDAQARRIRRLEYNGKPLVTEQEFLLATNDFRGGGGGNFPAAERGRQIEIPSKQVREAIIEHLSHRRFVSGQRTESWSFMRLPGVTAVFETGSGATKFWSRIDTPLEPLRSADDGFLRYRVDFEDDHWPQ
ncbi:MAG: hypothetical protein GY883_00905 [Shimia sp.]|nr:hypothetical protein [Shimia sp.]